MKTKYFWSGLVGLILLSAPQCSFAAATLKVGDKAPKLQVSKWVQGAPVKEFEKGKVYIVEFWATWCGPCRVSIPHLNEVHNKFKDKGVIVIGQNVWERDLDAVEPFVKKMGDKMTYRVALDLVSGAGSSSQGKMAENWMTAAGQNGIPAAFVINQQGRIAWIGHPMQLKEAQLEEIVAGTFDLDKAAVAYAKDKENEEALESIWKELAESVESKKWDQAEAKLKEAEKLIPEDDRAGLNMSRLQILLGKKDYKGANKLAEELSESSKDNPMLLNALAWEMATNENNKKLDLKLAEKVARRANEVASGKDPAILDTLARVVFMRGDHKKAIELQEKAIGLAEGDFKEHLEKVRDSYKKGELPQAE